jgi:catechol 2,3-dioxygenase-like lactoylglutathione lyase family enzyme
MKIKEIVLKTNDLSQTKLFYTQTLGFSILRQTDDSISFTAGNSLLSFQVNELVNQPVYHFAFNIPHNQLTEAITWLEERVTLLPVTDNSRIADFRQWNAEAVYFADNNGNILEFIARHDLNNSSNKTFSIAAVECISEMGIAVDHVGNYTEQLIRDHALLYFSKQAPLEKFAALGTDDGLLVIAEVKRAWYPTNISAEKFCTEILIEHDNRVRRLIHA